MLSIYQNSNAENNETIKTNFIARTAEYETIIASLKNRKSGDSIQHELILGRRGSGKSTLLKRIEIEISENEKLNSKYIPVNLAEEQAGIYRLMDLWEQVLQELYYQDEEKYTTKSFSEFTDEQEYTHYLYSEIHRFCAAKNKKAVLLLDNFDRIVGNFFDDGNLLRETLINYRDLVLITASTRMDEHFWSYDKPFYEFFRRHRLETLTSEETFCLLYHWSDSLELNDDEKAKMQDFLQKHRGKVENIRLLTDGLPRTMLFFLKLVLQTEKPVEADFLKKVMDEVTPLYQERLEKLTPQMRRIVLEMAFLWEAAATKEIAEKCRMESKLAAANLKTLTDRNIVETIATDKRNNLYRISERFFNMWLIVTQGNPEQKRKARWMSEFLECWYDKNELQDMAKQHIENLKSHKISGRDALILSKALSQSRYIGTFDRDVIIELTKVDLKDSINNYMIQLPETIQEIIEKAEHIEKTNYQQAINLINSIENEEDGWKHIFLGYIYAKQAKYDLAEKYYLMAIEKENDVAMYNLGNLYKNQAKYDLAEKYYLMAIEKEHINAMYNLGNLYNNQAKYDLAEKYWLMAIEKENISAMYNLSLMYYIQNRNKKQVKQYINKYEGRDIAKIIIEIWVGIFNNIEERTINICRKNEEKYVFIRDLLVFHQKSLVDKLFHHAEFGKRLQEKYTILYYASQILNGKENENNLRLRIPPELQSALDDVLKNIKSEQERYSK